MRDISLPRVMTVHGAARIGITEARLRTEIRRGRWRRLATGVVLTRPEEPTRQDWIQVGLALGGRDAAVTAWDAMRLRGIVFGMPPNNLVTVVRPRGRNRVVGSVRLRRSLRSTAVQTIHTEDDPIGVPVVGVARAICDAAADYHELRPIRAMATRAIQRRMCTPADLAREMAEGPRNGSRLLRQALYDVADGAQSVAEADAVRLLRRGKVPPFEVNVPISRADGTVVAVPDVLWRELRAVLEIDSREFHFDEEDWKETMRRHNVLLRLGYAVAHYPPSDIRRRGARWVDEVIDWLAARKQELGID